MFPLPSGCHLVAELKYDLTSYADWMLFDFSSETTGQMLMTLHNDHLVVAITIYMKKDPEEGGQIVQNLPMTSLNLLVRL